MLARNIGKDNSLTRVLGIFSDQDGEGRVPKEKAGPFGPALMLNEPFGPLAVDYPRARARIMKLS